MENKAIGAINPNANWDPREFYAHYSLISAMGQVNFNNPPQAKKDLEKILGAKEGAFTGISTDNALQILGESEEKMVLPMLDYVMNESNLGEIGKVIGPQGLEKTILSLPFPLEGGEKATVEAIANYRKAQTEIQTDPTKYVNSVIAGIHKEFRDIVFAYGAQDIVDYKLKSEKTKVTQRFIEGEGENAEYSIDKATGFIKANFEHYNAKKDNKEKMKASMISMAVAGEAYEAINQKVAQAKAKKQAKKNAKKQPAKEAA